MEAEESNGTACSQKGPIKTHRMRIDRLRADDALAALGLHKPARRLYRGIFGAEGRRRRKRLTHFFTPLIKPGDLVYDIGANIGVYSEIFCSLGARVVAVEPTPACVRHLRRWLESGGAVVIEAAIGSINGEGRLHLSKISSHSSMSDEWVQTVNHVSESSIDRWNGYLSVPVLTLNALSERYGRPDYVKIDVEGFEEPVLDGMLWQPRLLSFEFHLEILDSAFRCLSKPCISLDSRFNFIVGEPGQLRCDEWVSLEQLKRALLELGVGPGFGDIFVRRH